MYLPEHQLVLGAYVVLKLLEGMAQGQRIMTEAASSLLKHPIHALGQPIDAVCEAFDGAHNLRGLLLHPSLRGERFTARSL